MTKPDLTNTLAFDTTIDPAKRLPVDDASQAHLLALAQDVCSRADQRDAVEIEVDLMFSEEK